MRRYPAITLFVEITAKEHSAIAPFCEAHRITVGEFVTCRGVGFSMKDFTEDERNRLALLEEIADRFGGKWPPVPDGAERKLTPGLNVEALAMLEAMRIHDGYESIEAWIRKSLADSVLCLNEFITNTEPGTNRVRKAFGVLAQGSGRKPRRWRAAPSARMLRWRRPPSRRNASAKASKR